MYTFVQQQRKTKKVEELELFCSNSFLGFLGREFLGSKNKNSLPIKKRGVWGETILFNKGFFPLKNPPLWIYYLKLGKFLKGKRNNLTKIKWFIIINSIITSLTTGILELVYLNKKGYKEDQDLKKRNSTKPNKNWAFLPYLFYVGP